MRKEKQMMSVEKEIKVEGFNGFLLSNNYQHKRKSCQYFLNKSLVKVRPQTQ